MEGVLFDAEYLPILAETIGKGDRIWEITKKGIAGEIDWEQGLRTRVGFKSRTSRLRPSKGTNCTAS